MTSIVFEIGEERFAATLHDTPPAQAIADALPFDCAYSTWGEEIYFDCGVTAPEHEPRETVELGDVGYWPPGLAICLFYGATPVSGPGEIRPASAVEVIGRLDDVEDAVARLLRLRGRRVGVRSL